MVDAGGYISTHVLDTQRGMPAAGIRVRLEHLVADGAAVAAGTGVTDLDGRVAMLSSGPLVAGSYRLHFDLHDYSNGFFRSVTLELHVEDTLRSYHVPLLVSPFSVTSYRGS
jgi:5-hydroxyisourate hydrolase